MGLDETAMKSMLAYAFSTLPEEVELMLAQLNSSSESNGLYSHGFTATAAPLPFSPSFAGSPTGAAPFNPYGVQSPTPMPAAPQGTQNPFLSGGRRLPSTQEAQTRKKGRLISRRVTMRFKKGVHYVIDRPLVEMMMRHHMFQEMTDELSRAGHGPLFIESFEVYSDSEGKVGALDDSKNLAMERPWFLKYVKT